MTDSDLSKYLPPGKAGEFKVLRELTLAQIEKDFSLQGLNFKFPNLAEKSDYPALLNSLAHFLEKGDFLHDPKLRSLLYQLDLDERKTLKHLHDEEEEIRYIILAEQIIKRCFLKVLYRQKYSS